MKQKFGDGGYEKWLAALSPEAREVYSRPIMTGSWYPFTPIFLDSMKKVCEIFYFGRCEAAWQIGRFSAEHSLSGVHRFFIKFGSVPFIIGRAMKVFATYYAPSAMEAASETDHSAFVRILQFEEYDEFVEQRIAGWFERALEFMGYRKNSVQVRKSLLRGDPLTESWVRWAK